MKFRASICLLLSFGFLAQVLAQPVDGEWVWRMKGPNEEDVTGALEIRVDAGKVSGEFRTEAGCALKIRSGEFSGDKLRWTLVRDRPQGGEMIYEMDGTVSGDKITGEATAELDGRKVRVPWSAVRK